MTIFEVRELAAAIGRAYTVMPESDGEDLVRDVFAVVHRRRPDTTLDQWRALVSQWTDGRRTDDPPA